MSNSEVEVIPEYPEYIEEPEPDDENMPPFGYCSSENKIPAHGPNRGGFQLEFIRISLKIFQLS